MSLETLKRDKAMWAATLGQGKPAAQQEQPRVVDRVTITAATLPGDQLKQIIWSRFRVKACGECVATMVKMNAKGVAWCRENIDELIVEMKTNAGSKLWTAVLAKVAEVAGVLDYRQLILDACDACDPKPLPVRDESLCYTTIPDFPPIQRRNLLCHIWPTLDNDSWRVTVDMLKANLELFNGKLVIGIATDDKTHPASVVKECFAGIDATFIEAKNDPNLREVVTLLPMLSEVESLADNEATFYCHSKGASRGPDSTVHRWRDVMFNTLLDWGSVAPQLNRFPTVGTFKKLGLAFYADPNKSTSDWHFSGTFYWFRNAELFRRNWRQVDQIQWGAEPYPSLVFSAREAFAMIYVGSVPDMQLYHESYWNKTLTPVIAAMKKPPVVPLPDRRFIPAISYSQDLLVSARDDMHMAARSVSPEPDPFTAHPEINLLWHIFPRKGWQWHCDRLKEARPGFSRALVAVAYDETTAEPGEVAKYLGSDFEVHPIQNDPALREVKSAIELLPLVATDDPNSVTVWGHTKGMTHPGNVAVQTWAETLYENTLFRLDETLARMAYGFWTVGSFRSYGQFFKTRYQWHYVGGIYAFRTYRLNPAGGHEPFHAVWYGTETWVSEHVPPHLASCMFSDNCGNKELYQENAWPAIVKEHMQLEVERCRSVVPVRTEQHPRELAWLINRLKGCRSLLVIGSKDAGIERHVLCAIPDCRIVSVDLTYNSAAPFLIIGDSQSEATQNKVREHGPFDAVVIDGDHTLKGVTKDWEFAKSLNPKRIYFHDICEVAKHIEEGCHVHRLWSEIKTTHATSEMIVGCGWGGIGEVVL